MFLQFIHPSIYSDGSYYCGSRCEASFSVRNCVVFLAGTVRLTNFPCGSRVKRISTPDAKKHCSTWQRHVDSLHTSPHFLPLSYTQFSNSAKRQGSATKINPLSQKKCQPSITLHHEWCLPLRDIVWHSCLWEALMNVCSPQHGCGCVMGKEWLLELKYLTEISISRPRAWVDLLWEWDQNVTAGSHSEMLLIREA